MDTGKIDFKERNKRFGSIKEIVLINHTHLIVRFNIYRQGEFGFAEELDELIEYWDTDNAYWSQGENAVSKFGVHNGAFFSTDEVKNAASSIQLPSIPCDVTVNYYGKIKPDNYSSSYGDKEQRKFKVGDYNQLCNKPDLLAVDTRAGITHIYIKPYNGTNMYNSFIMPSPPTRSAYPKLHMVLFKALALPVALVADVISSPYQIYISLPALGGGWGGH